jgi:hydrogenase maturation protease
MFETHDTIVIGLGSWHGDDQVGWRLVESLCSCSQPVAPAFAVDEPIRVIDYLDDCDHLVIVDACRSGAKPGTIVRLVWPDANLGQLRSESSHSFGLNASLRLAEKLDKLPSRVVIYAVELGQCLPARKLSKEVECALPRLKQRVLQESTGATHA